ncbi:DUF4367 domain-containing protein [Candidatus Aerophobetes bacterium]|nr:DUF4367 domain-containing protein [Candidatus Aerophobetes bacterium]
MKISLKIKLLIICPAFLAVLLFILSTLAWAEEIEDILQMSLGSQFKANFEAIVEEKVYLPERCIEFKLKIIYKRPDFIYTELLEPSAMKGRITIDDGKRRMEYIPLFKGVKILPSFFSPQLKKSRQRMIRILMDNFLVKKLPDQQLLGREVYLFSILPPESENSLLKLWIDKETLIPLKREKYNFKGKLIFLSEYTALKTGQDFSLSKLLGKIPPPPDKEISPVIFFDVEKIKPFVKFSLSLPRYCPPGFSFQQAELVDRDTVKLVYTNGINLITIFQRPRVNIDFHPHRRMRMGEVNIRFKEGGFGNTLVWDGKEKSIVLIGEVPFEEMVKIARSMK